MKLILIVLLLITSQITFADESLGRLFSTPNERAALDQVRKVKREIVPQVVETSDSDAEQAPYVAPNSVAVQGYVKRSDGKSSTVWVNDHALQEDSANEDVAVGRLSNQNNHVTIKLKANGKYLSLKPGQVYDPETNRVREIRQAVHGDSGRIGDDDSP
ncbi:MAG: hypothetical protein ACXW1T_06055 [Methylophilus sp.]